MVPSKQMRQAGRRYWSSRLLTERRDVVVGWLSSYFTGSLLPLPTEVGSDLYEGFIDAVKSDRQFALDICSAFSVSLSSGVIATFMDLLEYLWVHDRAKAREFFARIKLTELTQAEIRRRIENYLEEETLPRGFREFLEVSYI